MKHLALASLFLLACGDDAASPDASMVGNDAGDDAATGDAGPQDAGGVDVPTAPDAGGDASGNDAAMDAGTSRMPIVVAYGWQGLTSLSIDEGETWCETGLMVDPHDDLFRSGTFSNGLFVGAHAGAANRGALIVSTNGYEWTALHRTNFEPDLPENPSGQWYGGVAYGNGQWLAVGGCGRMAGSPDGQTWTEIDRFVDGCLHIRSLAFGDGRFMAGLDDDTWWESTDTTNWSMSDEGATSQVVWNGSAFEGPIDGDKRWRGRGLCMWGQGWEDNAVIMRSTSADCSGAVEVAQPSHSVTAIAYGDAPMADFEASSLPDELRGCLGL